MCCLLQSLAREKIEGAKRVAKAEEAAAAAAAARLKAEEKLALLERDHARFSAQAETTTQDAIGLFQKQVRFLGHSSRRSVGDSMTSPFTSDRSPSLLLASLMETRSCARRRLHSRSSLQTTSGRRRS
jgi:hypothetical protein